MAKIKLDLSYAKYKNSRGNYIDNPVSGVVSGNTTAELYMTFEQVPVAFITVNKATVKMRYETSDIDNYIYYGHLSDIAKNNPQIVSQTLISAGAVDVDFIWEKNIVLHGNINAYLMYGIGFKGRDKGRTCTIYANSQSYRPYLELDYSVNYTASAKNIKVEHTDITQPTIVSWRTDLQQVSYEVQVVQGENVIFINTGSSSQSVSIPANTLLPGLDAIVKVKATERLLNTNVTSDYAEYNFKPAFTYPTIDNLSYVGEFWEKPITVNWRSTHQDGYEYECYYNNQKVSSGTGGTETSFTIPANTFTGTLPSSVRIRVYRLYGDNKYYSEWQERSLLLRDIEATISNLLVEGDYWEKPIKLSWQSTNQQQFKIEILKSNQVVKTYAGTTSTSYTIPAEQLTEGQQTLRVTVGYANRYVNSNEKTVTLKNIQSVVSDLALSGSNIDLELIFSWNSENQQKYEFEIYKDDAKVENYSGTTATSIVIPHSSLTTGLHRFRVRVAFKDRWTNWEEITSTLTETLPSIGAFEPDGVITERDNPTRVWWTSQNQSKWELVIDGTTTYNGTTEKEKILSPGALQTGKHSMVLTVTYRTGAGVEKHVTKKAEWIVQGKPPTPTIISISTFVTSRPTITWDTQDQQGYILEVLKDNEVVYSTDWQNGLIVEHKIKDYLENGIYTVRVKVMNQYSLESDWGTKQITINAQIEGTIDLDTLLIKETVRLKWDNTSNKFMKFYILRNDEVIAKTTDTSYVDYTVFGECRYKIRGITVNDVYRDSNICYERCDIRHGIVATIDQLNESIDVGLSRNEFSFNASISLENNTIMLSGRELPVTIFGEHSNNTYSIKFTSKELFKFLEMCKRRQVFLYRDKRQKLYLSITNPSYTIDMLGIEYTVQAIEVDYSEVIGYD